MCTPKLKHLLSLFRYGKKGKFESVARTRGHLHLALPNIESSSHVYKSKYIVKNEKQNNFNY